MKRGCVKYHEVVETLRNEILSGKYVAHKPFPSQTKLIARFGISKLTVVKVLDRLKDLGLVCSRQGRGTFVTRTAGQRKIGLIIPGVGYSEFFPPIAAEIARLAEKGGYRLLLGEVNATAPAERIRQVRELAEEMIAPVVVRVSTARKDLPRSGGSRAVPHRLLADRWR